MKIEQDKPGYLVQDVDGLVYEDLFHVLYGNCPNLEDEILMSLHLLDVWMENDFEN